MKYRTKLYALSGTAAVLAVLIALGLLFSPANNQKRAMKGETLSAKAKDKVAAVKIESGGQSVNLKKSGDGWIMEKPGIEFPASEEKVKAFLSSVSSANELFRVSSKKESYASFGLEPAVKKIVLSDSGGKSLASLLLGNTEAGGKKIYIAFEGKDAVYSVKNAFDSFLRTDDRSWGDLRLVRQEFKDGDIQEITVKAKLPKDESQEAVNLDYRLIRNAKKGWVVDGDSSFSLDESRVDLLVRSVSGLEGDSFVADKRDEAKKSLEAPAVTLAFRSGKGSEFRILASLPDADKKHALREEGSETMLYTSAWTLRNCLKDLESLRYKEPEKKGGTGK